LSSRDAIGRISGHGTDRITKSWHHLRAITLGERVLWRNPFGDARLSDDELAVATVLRAMRRYVNEGVEFYGIPDAAEDQ
jgi:hypothetical protein